MLQDHIFQYTSLSGHPTPPPPPTMIYATLEGQEEEHTLLNTLT